MARAKASGKSTRFLLALSDRLDCVVTLSQDRLRKHIPIAVLAAAISLLRLGERASCLETVYLRGPVGAWCWFSFRLAG
jgi:hypothetical protein